MASETQAPETANGTTQAAEAVSELTPDEREFINALLNHERVCAILTSQAAKAMAANIQAKLNA